MGLRYRSRAPKKKEFDGLETALKMILYPIAIIGAVLFGDVRKKGRRKK